MDNDYQAALNELVGPALPSNTAFSLLHIASLPQRCRKLVFTSKHDLRTDSLVTHYFLLAYTDPATRKSVPVYVLEIFTYESLHNYTIFVSKADTAGYYGGPKLSIKAVTQAMLRALIQCFAPANKPVRVCLFAKAEQQYLFLGSVDNPQKHVLSDAELVKWWASCLDGCQSEALPSSPAKARISIPGIDEDRLAIAKYFPVHPRFPWQSGDIFNEFSGAEEANDDLVLAVKRIPRFPDDPKSRFLDTIVEDRRAKQVTKRQFWQELQSRQEFRLGKSVGIIGIEFTADGNRRRSNLKLPGASKPVIQRFKDLLISLRYETCELAENSMTKLVRGTDSQFWHTITGSKPELAPKRPLMEAVPINTLSVVRKKRKT